MSFTTTNNLLPIKLPEPAGFNSPPPPQVLTSLIGAVLKTLIPVSGSPSSSSVSTPPRENSSTGSSPPTPTPTPPSPSPPIILAPTSGSPTFGRHFVLPSPFPSVSYHTPVQFAQASSSSIPSSSPASSSSSSSPQEVQRIYLEDMEKSIRPQYHHSQLHQQDLESGVAPMALPSSSSELSSESDDGELEGSASPGPKKSRFVGPDIQSNSQLMAILNNSRDVTELLFPQSEHILKTKVVLYQNFFVAVADKTVKVNRPDNSKKAKRTSTHQNDRFRVLKFREKRLGKREPGGLTYFVRIATSEELVQLGAHS